MRSVRINVDAECIKKGIRRSACDCPVALAMRKKFKKNVLVGRLTFRFAAFGNNEHKLPPKVRAFINEFDNSEPVQPFSFLVAI